VGDSAIAVSDGDMPKLAPARSSKQSVAVIAYLPTLMKTSSSREPFVPILFKNLIENGAVEQDTHTYAC
jgi:hypothetical protein